MLDKIVTTGYDKLNLMYFFTTGEDEVKAWTIKKGTKAPQAAGKIHNDFEKGFQKAEVYTYADFKELGSEVAIKVCFGPHTCNLVYSAVVDVYLIPCPTPSRLCGQALTPITLRQAAGKFMTKGKDYVVQDGDVIHFKVNTAGMKK